MTLKQLFLEVGAAVRRGWGVMLVGAALVSAAVYLAAMAVPGAGGLVAAAGFTVFWISLRATAGMSAVPTRPAEGVRLLLSLTLKWLILSFLALLTVMAVILCTLAIMAGGGFDFEASAGGGEAAEAAMAAFQATPGWQLAQVLALLATLLMAGAVARGLAVAAASLAEARIVAMEAFNWTRGQAARLTVVMLGALAMPLALFVLAALARDNTASDIAVALGTGLCVVLGAVLSTASYRCLRTQTAEIAHPV